MKKLFLILLLIFISCKTDKEKPEQENKVKKNDFSLIKPLEKIKYVTAKSGLIYRNKPNGEYLGKLDFNSKVTIIEKTNGFQEIKNGNEIIKGEWVGLKLHNDKTVYVFDGFLSNSKQEYPKTTFEETKQYLYNGIWVSKKFKSILEKSKLYSKAGYYRGCPHNIIFYKENQVSSWSENEMEELSSVLNKDMTISGAIDGKIIMINNSNLTIQIGDEQFIYFKIDRPFTSNDRDFEVVRKGSSQAIKNWFSGDYILTTENNRTNLTFRPNKKNDFLYAWYKDYDNNILIDVIDIYGDLYKISKIENSTYFLDQIEPFGDDFTELEAIPTGKKATLTKVRNP